MHAVSGTYNEFPEHILAFIYSDLVNLARVGSNQFRYILVPNPMIN